VSILATASLYTNSWRCVSLLSSTGRSPKQSLYSVYDLYGSVIRNIHQEQGIKPMNATAAVYEQGHCHLTNRSCTIVQIFYV
jgi:hypothetical protein